MTIKLKKKSGRPRTPSALKLIRGTWRQDRAPRNEPQPTPVLPAPPSILSPRAREEWLKLTLEMPGVLTVCDLGILQCYCEAVSDWEEATALSATTPDGKSRKVVVKDGELRINPYTKLKRLYGNQIAQYGSALGLTPASRTMIESRPADPAPSARWQGFNSNRHGA